MQEFYIGPMCVTKEDFKQQLEENGLKFGYIKRLYEKWKDGDLTYFRIILEGSPFVIVTDDENSYPEIQEDSEKEIEPYSLEWLDELIYNTKLAGPISSEALLLELEMYLRVNKAKQCDETRKQEKCQYCHGKEGLDAGFHANAVIGKDESGNYKNRIVICSGCQDQVKRCEARFVLWGGVPSHFCCRCIAAIHNASKNGRPIMTREELLKEKRIVTREDLSEIQRHYPQ